MAAAVTLSLLVMTITAVFAPAVASAAGPVTLFNAVHQGQQQGNWNVGLWKHYGDGVQDGAVNKGGSGAIRWGPNGVDGWTHSFTLTYNPITYTLSFSVVNQSGTKTITESTTSPVVPPSAPGPVNNLHMVIAATAGTGVTCTNQAGSKTQQVDSSSTTVSDLMLDGSPLAGLVVEAKLVDNPTAASFTNKVEADYAVPGDAAWTLTGKITVGFSAADMNYPPKQNRIGMPSLAGQYKIQEITVTANTGQTKVYGSSDPLPFTYTASEEVTFTGALDRIAGENVGSYAIGQGDLDAGPNYKITFMSNDFTITPKDASVTPDAASKTYGDSDPTLTGILEGFLAGDDVTATYSRAPGETVAGSPYTISATLSPTEVLGNYDITYNTAEFSITKAALNIKADDKSKAFGAALPTLTVTYTGLANGDSAPATPPTIGTTATVFSPVGTYPITATGAADANYIITYTEGTLAVNKAGTTVVLTSSCNPSLHLLPVTFTATVGTAEPGAGTPTGTVTFKDGTTTLGTATLDSAGKATYRTPCLRSLRLGDHSITAVYNGDASFDTSTSALTQKVLSLCQWIQRWLDGCR